MICKTCSFSTDRLTVGEWHSLSTPDREQNGLAQVVATMLTEPVTRMLPPAWQGDYTVSRAREWIRERDQYGTTLLVNDKSTNEPVGLVILIEVDSENALTALRFDLAICCQNRPGVEGWPPNWSRGLLTGVERRHPLPHWQVELTQTIQRPYGYWKRTGSILSKQTPERPKNIGCINYDCNSDPCTPGM